MSLNTTQCFAHGIGLSRERGRSGHSGKSASYKELVVERYSLYSFLPYFSGWETLYIYIYNKLLTFTQAKYQTYCLNVFAA